MDAYDLGVKFAMADMGLLKLADYQTDRLMRPTPMVAGQMNVPQPSAGQFNQLMSSTGTPPARAPAPAPAAAAQATSKAAPAAAAAPAKGGFMRGLGRFAMRHPIMAGVGAGLAGYGAYNYAQNNKQPPEKPWGGY